MSGISFRDTLRMLVASKNKQRHRTVGGTKRARQMISNTGNRTGGIIVSKEKKFELIESDIPGNALNETRTINRGEIK